MLSLEKQKNYHFFYSVGINQSHYDVWKLLTNVTRWKDWDTELKSATLAGDFQLGAQGVLTPKKGPQLSFTISELVPEQSYTFTTKLPLGYLRIKRSLSTKNQLVYFTDSIQFTGVLKKVFGAILGNGFKKVIPEVMENFKRLAEQQPS